MRDLTQEAQDDLNRMTQTITDTLDNKFHIKDPALIAAIRIFLKAAYLRGAADEAIGGLAEDSEPKGGQ